MTPARTLRLLPMVLPLVMLFMLAGCTTMPVPEDHFYRLPDPRVTAGARALEGTLAVQRLRTDGVYAQRPLLHCSDIDSVEVHQYHYHYWTDSPPRLLQDHLVAYLRGSGIASTTLADGTGIRADYVLSGRIRRFEQLQQGGKASALVELELALQERSGSILLVKDYRAEFRAANNSLPATVTAFDQALQQIYARLNEDLRNLKRQ